MCSEEARLSRANPHPGQRKGQVLIPPVLRTASWYSQALTRLSLGFGVCFGRHRVSHKNPTDTLSDNCRHDVLQ